MNNRQAGRRRGRGGQRPGGSPGRPDNGNRIDNRSRGNAAQLLEKYKNLAADSQRSGDRVNTEYYLQFADHYFRVLSETRSRYEETRRGQDDGNDDDGDDYGYEGDVGNQSDDYREPQREARDNRDNRQPRENQRDGQRDNGQRDGQREYRDRDDTRGNDSRERNDNRDRNDNRGDRQANGGERQDRAPRRERQPREDRPMREERPRVIANDAEGDAPEVRDARPAPANDAATAEPRRRGRPRREAVPEADGGFDVAVLPPAIGIDSTPVAPAADDGEEARPRRRRRIARADEDMVPPAA